MPIKGNDAGKLDETEGQFPSFSPLKLSIIAGVSSPLRFCQICPFELDL